LQWIVEDLQPHYRSQPAQYVTFFLAHEGENSLASLLIDEGLAYEVQAYDENCMGVFTQLGIKISLTEEGFENYEKVVAFVFEYVKMLQRQGVQRWVFEEQARIQQIAFQFKDREEVSEFTTRLAEKMHLFPLRDLLRSHH
jgi:insulysin